MLTPVQRAYLAGYVATTVMCFTPFKLVTYALPLALVAYVVITVGTVGMRNRIAAVGAAAIALGMFYDLVAPELLVTNFLLALVTYSAALPLVVIEARPLASTELYSRLVRVAIGLLAVEGAVGIIQAIYGVTQTGSLGGANGDYVAGTIHPYLGAELAFSNPVFAVDMTMLLVATCAVPDLARRHVRTLAAGALALVLASVVHVLVFLAVAVAFAFVVVPRSRRATRQAVRRTGRLVEAGIVVAAVGYAALESNLEAVPRVGAQMLDLDAIDIPRAILLGRVATELPEDAPLQPFVGLGPGQFSSRASLIASGLYLGGPDSPRPVPLLAPRSTRLASSYCFSLLVAYKESELVIGSSEQPFFSWLSIYTELGGLGVVLVFGAIAAAILRVRRRVHARPALRARALAFVTGTTFLALVGLQDNYWEAPQAMLPGLLLLLALYATIRFEPTDA